MATSQAFGAFPPSLGQVAAAEQVVERFVWLYGYFGALATVGAILSLLPGNTGWRGNGSLTLGVACMALGGPAAIWWEWQRHQRRLVLVRRDAQIGVYQAGQFVRAIGADELHVRQENSIRRFRLRLSLFLFFAMGVGMLSTPVWSPDNTRWFWMVVGALMVVPCVAGLRSQFDLLHCVIRDRQGEREFMLSTRDMARVAKG